MTARLNVWALRIVPPLGYLVWAVVAYSRWWSHPTRGVPGGPDGLLYSWYFKWTEYSLLHGHNPFITDWLNAPRGINAMWNTGVFGLSVLFAPITFLVGPIAATGLAMMLSPVACATTCYFVLRSITGTGWRAAFVSLLYGFGPYFIGQAGHLHLIFAVFPPLILLFGYRIFVQAPDQVRQNGIWLGVVVGLQLITGEEVLVLTAVGTLVAILALMALNPAQVGRRAPSVLRTSALGLGVALLISIVPLSFQFLGSNAIHGGFVATSQRVGIDSLVTPSALQRSASRSEILFNVRAMPADGVENTGFLGWPLLIVIAASCCWLILRRERFIWWWLLTTATVLILSFGAIIQIDKSRVVFAHGPWAVARKFPLMSGIVPVRFSLITTFLIVLLLAWALARLPRGPWAVLGLVVVMGSMIPLLPARRYGEIQDIQTPQFFTTSAVNTIAYGSTTLVLPISNRPQDGSRVMTWQAYADMRFKLVGGWGVFVHRGRASYNSYLPDFVAMLARIGLSGVPPTEPELQAGQKSLATSGIHYIVITKQQAHAQQVRDAVAIIAGCEIRPVSDVSICSVGSPGS